MGRGDVGTPLDYWKQQTRVVTVGATALEVGAAGNNGGLSLWLANSGFHVAWSGLEEPEPLARELHRANHVDGSIRYEQIDVLDIPYKNAFDVVTFSPFSATSDWSMRDAAAVGSPKH